MADFLSELKAVEIGICGAASGRESLCNQRIIAHTL
jgi:hypothetical protein